MRIRRPITTGTQVALGVACFVCVIALYAWLSYRQHQINPRDTTIPGLGQFAEGWKRILQEDAAGQIWLWNDVAATYWRLGVGLLAGVVFSFAVGILMGCYTRIGAFLEPTVSFFAKVPPTAMLAVYFVLFGTELKMFVAMIALGIFPSLALSIYQAVRKDVTEHAIDKAYSLGAGSPEVIWEVVCQQILPRVIESVRLQIGPAMVFLIAAEMLVADIGFGYRLRIRSRVLDMSVVYTYLAILGATGLLFDWLLLTARRKLAPWFGD